MNSVESMLAVIAIVVFAIAPVVITAGWILSIRRRRAEGSTNAAGSIRDRVAIGFSLAGFLTGVAAEMYSFVRSFTAPGPASALADRLLLVLCPPSGGSTIIRGTSNGHVVWMGIIVANMFLYGLLGFLVGSCIPKKSA